MNSLQISNTQDFSDLNKRLLFPNPNKEQQKILDKSIFSNSDIYLQVRQALEVETSNTATNKLIQSLDNKYSPYKYFCRSPDAKSKATAYIDACLPKELRGVTQVHKLIVELTAGHRHTYNGHEDWVCIPSIELKNSYKMLYRPSLNKLLPRKDGEGKPMSIISVMLQDEIIYRDERASKLGGKAYWFRMNRSMFGQRVEKEIMKVILKSQKTTTELSHDKPKYEENFNQLLNRHYTSPTSDIYTFKNHKEIKLTGLAQSLLQRGMFGINFIARQLILEQIEIMDKALNKDAANRIMRDLDHNIMGGTNMAIASTYGVGLSGEAIATNMLCIPHSTVSYSMMNLPILKLMTALGNSISTCNNGQILIHKAPQIISYTGRFYESNGLGTTGMKREIKDRNYRIIEGIIGQEIYNYDLKGSQISGLLHISKLHNFHFPHLTNYVNDTSVRELNAVKVGVPTSVYKVLVLICIFGGSNSYNEHHGSSFQTTLEDAGHNPNDIERLIHKFNDVSWGMVKEIKTWLNVVVPIALESSRLGLIGYRAGLTILDKAFFDTDSEGKKYSVAKSNRMKSAFLLQGLETLFIGTLMSLCTIPEFKFKPLSYEYDGIISLGKIPQQAIDEAIRLTEYPEAKLEVKPIN